MEKITRAMKELAGQAQSFALATVITRNGSAPRSAGAKMLVRSDGTIVGTVGGGSLEAKVQALARGCILSHQALIRSFSFTGKDAADMDSICGGEIEVLIESMDVSDANNLSVISGLITVLNQHQKAWLVTSFSVESQATSHTLIQSDGATLGSSVIGLADEKLHGIRSLERLEVNGQTIIIEPVNISGTAYIFGAGHVSRSLAEFVKAVGFYTVVIDNRAEYANRERFPEADEIIVPVSFEEILSKIEIDPFSFLVIVTRGHVDDYTVLAQALKTDAAYIGMIGSRRKCELIYQQLEKEGFTKPDIQRVHGPIGLPILAETPEEIGVSIVAEMIRARAQMILPQ